MRARPTLSIALVTLGSLLLSTPASAEQAFQAGRWEVTVDVSAPGSEVRMPSSSQTECLTQAELDRGPVPELERGACKATHIQRSGDTTTWDLDCGPLGKGRGEIIFRSPVRYDGWMTLDASGTTVRASIVARRIGDC